MQTPNPNQPSATTPATPSATASPPSSEQGRGAVAGTTVLASYDNYIDAQALVDRLSDEGFPVETTAIVGSDLRLVEHVTGRRGYGRASLEGAGAGAVTGFLIGLFLTIFTLFETVAGWLSVLLSWTILGAVVGLVLGLLAHAMRGGRRDFSSTSRMVPARFDVVVATERVEQARTAAGLDRV